MGQDRLSKENALTICDYIIAMKREINPRINTIRSTIQFLSELSKAAGIEKKFEDTTSALHADKSVERSLANLQYKEQIEKSEYEKTLNNISETSKIIMTYELVTILLIVGAGLAGTSEVTKNKLVGYPGFVIGGTGIIILLLFLFTGTTV
jgi:hypothetical protein